jgi:hypothetical protein
MSAYAHVPNAFVQTYVPPPTHRDGDSITMRITCGNVCGVGPKILHKNFVYLRSKRTNDHIIKALYSTECYNQCSYFLSIKNKDLASIGLETNPYDPCDVHRTVNGKRHTLT